MSQDVRQDFLQNAKYGRSLFTAQLNFNFDGFRLPMTLNTRARLKLLHLPFDRRDQAEIVEDAWTKFGGDSAYATDCGLDQSRHGADSFVNFRQSRTIR